MGRSRLLCHLRGRLDGTNDREHVKPISIRVRDGSGKYVTLYASEDATQGSTQLTAPGGNVEAWIDGEGLFYVEFWRDTTKYGTASVWLWPKSSSVVEVDRPKTIQAVHTFNPTSVGAPFVLGANARGQLVQGLNAELWGGKAPGDLVIQYVLGLAKTSAETFTASGFVAMETVLRDTYGAWDAGARVWRAPRSGYVWWLGRLDVAVSGASAELGVKVGTPFYRMDRIDVKSNSTVADHTHGFSFSVGTTTDGYHGHGLGTWSTSTDGAHTHTVWKWNDISQDCTTTCTTATQGAHSHGAGSFSVAGSGSHSHSVSGSWTTSSAGAHSHVQAAGEGFRVWAAGIGFSVAAGDAVGLYVSLSAGSQVTVGPNTLWYLLYIPG